MKKYLFIYILFIPAIVFAQETYQSLQSYNQPLLDIYLNKADSQKSKEEWLEIARTGIDSVLADWENTVSFDNKELLQINRNQIAENINSIVEKRFTTFLINEFSENTNGEYIKKLNTYIDELNLKLLYENNENGEAITDENGKYIYKNIEGLYDKNISESEIVFGDATIFSNAIKQKVEQLVKEWENSLISSYSEIVASLDEALKEKIQILFSENTKTQKESFIYELDKIWRTEQSLFLNYRIGDYSSLYAETERTSAQQTTKNLIDSTKTILDENLNVLLTELDQEIELENNYKNQSHSSWTVRFQEMLQTSLDSWNEAEEKLLMDRIEWERNATVSMQESEKIWQDSFALLRNERSNWFTKYQNILSTGNNLWSKQNEELNETINTAILEIKENAEAQNTSLSIRVNTIYEMLMTSVNMMLQSKASWEYWMQKSCNTKYLDIENETLDIHYMREYFCNKLFANDKISQRILSFVIDESYNKDTELKENIKNIDIDKAYTKLSQNTDFSIYKAQFKDKLESIINTFNNLEPDFKEAYYWQEKIFIPYQKQVEKYNKELISTYGIVVFANENINSAFDKDGNLQQLISTKDLLNNETAYDNFYLDELQVAILKAKAFENYWKKNLDIAEAVYAYMIDETKESSQETITNLENAKLNYEEALSLYNTNLEQLNNYNYSLGESKKYLEKLQNDFSLLQTQLDNLQTTYTSYIADLEMDNKEYLSKQFESFFDELLDLYGLNPNKEDESISNMISFMDIAKKYSYESELQKTTDRLQTLITGEKDNYLNSLSCLSMTELQNRISSIEKANFNFIDNKNNYIFLQENVFQNILEKHLYINQNDEVFPKLMELCGLYNNALSSNDTDTLYKTTYAIFSIALEQKYTYEYEYKNRRNEIELLSSNNFDELCDSWNITKLSTNINTYNAYLENNQNDILKNTITRIEMEIEILNSIKNHEHEIQNEFSKLKVLNTISQNLNISYYKKNIYDYIKNESQLQNIELEICANNYLKLLEESKSILKNYENKNLDLFLDFIETNSTNSKYNALKRYLFGSSYFDLIINTPNLSLCIEANSNNFSKYSMNNTLEQNKKDLLKNNSSSCIVLKEISNAIYKSQFITFITNNKIGDENSLFEAEVIWNNNNFNNIDEVLTYLNNFNTFIKDLDENSPEYFSYELNSYYDYLIKYFALKAKESNFIASDISELENHLTNIESTIVESLKIINSKDNQSKIFMLHNFNNNDQSKKQLLNYSSLDFCSFLLQNNSNDIESMFTQFLKANNYNEQEIEILYSLRNEIIDKSYNTLLMLYSLEYASPENLSSKEFEFYKQAKWKNYDAQIIYETVKQNQSFIKELWSTETQNAIVFSLYDIYKNENKSISDTVLEIEEILVNNNIDYIVDEQLLKQWNDLYNSTFTEEKLKLLYNGKTENYYIRLKKIALGEYPVQELSQQEALDIDDFIHRLDFYYNYNPLLYNDYEQYKNRICKNDLQFLDDINSYEANNFLFPYWNDNVFTPEWNEQETKESYLQKLKSIQDINLNKYISSQIGILTNTINSTQNDYLISNLHLCLHNIANTQTSSFRDFIETTTNFAKNETEDKKIEKSKQNKLLFDLDVYDKNISETEYERITKVGASSLENSIIDSSIALYNQSLYLAYAFRLWGKETEQYSFFDNKINDFTDWNNILFTKNNFDLAQTSYNEELKNREEHSENTNNIILNMISYGNRINVFNNKLESDAKIKDFENEISIKEEELKLLNGQLTNYLSIDENNKNYFYYENLYKEQFNYTEELYKVLENNKHEYTKAKSIYDYATSGYLKTIDSLMLEQTNDLYSQQEIEDREYYINEINRTTPHEQLKYAQNNYTKAKAALDVLIKIDENKTNTSFYNSNLTYKNTFDHYEKLFTEKFVLNEINNVVNEAISKQEEVMNNSYQDLQDSINKIVSTNYISSDSFKLNDSFIGYSVITDEQNRISIDYNYESTTKMSEADFEKLKTIEEGQSKNNLCNIIESFLKDADKYFPYLQEWSNASLYIQYQNIKSTEELSEEENKKSWFDSLINTNNYDCFDLKPSIDENMMQNMENSYNNVCAYEKEYKEAFSLFKFINDIGVFGLDYSFNGTSTTNGNFDDLAKTLFKKDFYEKIIEKINVEHKNCIVAAHVYATLSATYTLLAINAFLNPLMVAGILFASLAVLNLFRSTSYSNKASNLKDLNNKANNELIQNSENCDNFVNAFSSEINTIKEKQLEYDKQKVIFENLICADKNNENSLSSEQKIENLTTYILDAYKLKYGNTNSLENLIKSTEHHSLNNLISSYFISNNFEECNNNSSLLLSIINSNNNSIAQYQNEINTIAYSQNKIDQENKNNFYTSFNSFLNSSSDTNSLEYQIELQNFTNESQNAFTEHLLSNREHLFRETEQNINFYNRLIKNSMYNNELSNICITSFSNFLLGENGINSSKQEAITSVKESELSLIQKEQHERYIVWQNQMRAILARGSMEWTDNEKKLLSHYNSYLQTVKQEYENKSQMWNDKYLAFLIDKRNWTNIVAEQSKKNGDESVFDELDSLTQNSISYAGNEILITSLSSIEDSSKDIISSKLNFSLLSKLLETANLKNQNIGSFKPTIFSSLKPQEYTSNLFLEQIQNSQNLDNEELKKHSIEIQISSYKEELKNAEKLLEENIENSNISMNENIDSTITSSGYKRVGDKYEKTAITGSSVFSGLEEEKFTVKAYEYYKNYDLDISSEIDFVSTRADSLDSETLTKAINTVMLKVKSKIEEIFGKDNETAREEKQTVTILVEKTITKEVEDKDRFVNDDKNYYVTPEKYVIYEPETIDRVITIHPGLFGKHIGYAPEFETDLILENSTWDAEGNIKFSGSGELGEIMGQFVYNSMREQKGVMELNMPFYNKPLWDDRKPIFGENSDIHFEAPSLRKVIEIGSNIALTIASSGTITPLLSSGVSFGTETIFSLLDFSNNVISPEQLLVNLGKSVLSNAVSCGIGTGFDKYTENALKGLNSFNSYLTSGTLNSMNTWTSSFLTNAINSFEFNYNEEGNFVYSGFNSEAFEQGLKSSAINVASGFAKSLTTGTINTINSNDKMLMNFSDISLANVNNLSSLIGDSVSLATTYALTGNVKLNLLNTGVFTQKPGIGLLEFGFGKDGTSFAIGSGGTQVSIENLISAISGVSILYYNNRIKNYEKSNYKIGNTLAFLYSNGDKQGIELVRSILNKDTEIIGNAEIDAVAKTELVDNKKVIYFNQDFSELDGNDNVIGLENAIIFQHEAHRDGIVGSEEEQKAETYDAFKAHSAITMAMTSQAKYKDNMGIILDQNETIRNDMLIYGLESENNDIHDYVYENYDSSDDYWKLITNGKNEHYFLDDGKAQLSLVYVDENGKEINTSVIENDQVDNKDKYYSLAKILGIQQAHNFLSSYLGKEANNTESSPFDYFKNIESEEQLYSVFSVLLKYKLSKGNSEAILSKDETKDLKITSKPIDGYICTEVNNGNYYHSAVNVSLYRNPISWDSISFNKENDSFYSEMHKEKQCLDTLVFIKKGITQEYVESIIVNQIQSVDNYVTKKDGSYELDEDSKPILYNGKLVQENTIVNDFNLGYLSTSNSYDLPVLTINSCTTIGEIEVDNRAMVKGSIYSARWLVHQNKSINMTNDYKQTWSNGCFMTSTNNFEEMLNRLKSWNLPQNYQIKGTIVEQTYNTSKPKYTRNNLVY